MLDNAYPDLHMLLHMLCIKNNESLIPDINICTFKFIHKNNDNLIFHILEE